MAADTAMAPIERNLPRVLPLVAIPLGFAVLGFLLRLIAYLQAGWEPRLSAYPDGLCRWDCQWYANLATGGYDPFPVPTLIDAGNWAFFPLYPAIVGGLRALTGLQVMDVASAVSMLFAGLAAMVAWPLFERNMRAYALYCAFLLCGPFSIYFTTFYTEVLFVLLTNCVLLALRRGNYLAAGVCAGLLSATRIVGAFMVLTIALQYLLDYRQRGGTLRGLPAQLWRRPEIVLAVLLAPAGLFAYMAYLYFYMGDALAFSHVQRAWGRVPGNPLMYLWIGLTDWPKEGFWPSTNQWLGLAAIGGLAVTAVLAIRRQFAVALFSLICLVVPLSAGMASMLRFVVALSPVVLPVIALLAKWRPLFVVSLIAFVAADYFFTIGWLEEWLPLV
ncbi:MAG: hypothetical protein P4M09_00425 [Devosia sp.]|nr:hypothetical protein [Devosia sp.]